MSKPIRVFVLRSQAVLSVLLAFLSSWSGEEMWEVVIRQYDPKRSLEQNGLGWLIVTAVAEQVRPNGQAFGKDVWWSFLKREHFGPEIVEFPDGSFVEREPSSRDRGTRAFSEFIEFLFWWSADNGVVLPQEAHALRREMERA